MSFRNMIPFLLLVFLVAVAGTYGAIQFFGEAGVSNSDPEVRLVTVEVIITATRDPLVTPDVIIITATSDRAVASIPDGILGDDDDDDDFTAFTAPTLDPDLLGADEQLALTATSLPPNCLLHVVAPGDTPFGIAQEYGANGFLLLEVNGLTDQTAARLQIGQTLIVPLPGCNYNLPPTATPTLDPAVATPEPEETPDPDDLTPQATPTITLVPTATNAQVSILTIENVGDVTAEGVRIRNEGATVNITGWTLTNSDGAEYVFTEQFLFSNAELTVYSRAGQDSPIARFWGLNEPVWRSGDVATLTDAEGRVQATIRVGAPISLD